VLPLGRAGHAGVAICFLDVSVTHALELELQRSSSELETAYEELQSANEELETTNEELQSTIEELETTNEELQATNEELETMNEELHATVEEMESINAELSRRTAELNELNQNVEAILGSLRPALVVLDARSRVRVWNRGAENLWGLREEEVLNQLFFGLDIGLPVQQLREAVRGTLEGTQEHAEIRVDATDRRGRPAAVRVVVSPFLDRDRTCQGAVLLMERADANGTTAPGSGAG
jgi:two-component system, chemotaxis family, CheB/CheR fusion protein